MFNSFLRNISFKKKEERKVICNGNTIQDFIKLYPTLKGIKELILTEKDKYSCKELYLNYVKLVKKVIAESSFANNVHFPEVNRVLAYVISYIQWSFYSQVFPKVPSEEDKLINQYCKAMKNLRPEEFDVKTQNINMSMFKLAIKELQKSEHEYTVEAKMNNYLTLHEVIGKGITTLTDKIPGADDITPIIVYLIVQATPEMINSNIRYIETYKVDINDKMTGEGDYCIRGLQMAVEFIKGFKRKHQTS